MRHSPVSGLEGSQVEVLSSRRLRKCNAAGQKLELRYWARSVQDGASHVSHGQSYSGGHGGAPGPVQAVTSWIRAVSEA